MSNLPLNSVGEMLRKAREKKRLSPEEVNIHTKISLPVIQALEQDDFESFESETYLKGFLRNYAVFLQVDFELLQTTLERQRGRVHTGKGTLWDIEEMMTEEKLKSPRLLSRFVVPALILLVLILTVLLVRKHRAYNQLIRSGKQSSQHESGGAAESVRVAALFSSNSDGTV
jgi:cytoskeleton protein RodZ